MPPENPYDFSGYLSDQLDASSGLVHGYTGQLDSFRSQLDELNTYAETGYAPVLGGTLLGAIGAALAGGSMAQVASAGYGAGGAAYNNLEKIEAEKRKDLIQQIADTESHLKDQINFSQQLVGAQAGYNRDMALSYQRGEIPGTQPNLLEFSQEVAKARQLYGVRNPVEQIDPTVAADIAAATGKSPELIQGYYDAFGKGTPNILYSTGQNVKTPEGAILDKINASKDFKLVTSQMKDLVSEMGKEELAGFGRALQAGNVTELYKDPKSAAYKFYSLIPLAQKAIARQNDSGALSAIDVDMFGPLVKGSPVYDDPETLRDRLNFLENYSDGKLSNIIGTATAGRRNMSGFTLPSGGDVAAPVAPTAVEQIAAAPLVSPGGTDIESIRARKEEIYKKFPNLRPK